jgi:hypothetical protein
VGYVPKETHYELTWPDDSDFAGLEVVTRSASTRVYNAVGRLATVEHTVPPSAEALEATVQAADAFAAALVSWNVETKDGTPVPATAEGLLDQEPLMVAAIMGAWMDALLGARPTATPDAPEFDEGDLPMSVATA